MSELTAPPGFYGKLPSLGDFASRRLNAAFIDTWDQWLQSAMAASQEQLGNQWLEIYLTSPIWHFILSPGICGRTAWAGILTPSVDRVGRYFPLTFAAAVSSQRTPFEVFTDADQWFMQLEKLALAVLEDELDIDQLDRRLMERKLPGSSGGPRPVYYHGEGKLAYCAPMKALEDIGDAAAYLGFRLLAEIEPTYSLWRTRGAETVHPCLRVFSNLPPHDTFADLLISRQNPPQSVPQKTPEPTEEYPDTASLLEEASPNPLADDQDRVSVLDHSFHIPSGELFYQLPPDETAAAVLEASPADVPLTWRSFAATTAGKRRKINQDAYLDRPQSGLWVVADGMGGHHAGEVASRAAVDALAKLMPTGHLDSFAAYAAECLHAVNEDLYRLGRQTEGSPIIGTTVAAMLAVGARCRVIWAGDSRIYRFREGRLTQLTIDHSLTAQRGAGDPDGARNATHNAMDHIVTRALGADVKLELDHISFDARADDLYLLCSDGLVKEISDLEIAGTFRQGECRAISQALIQKTLERGARDNVTVVVARADMGKGQGRGKTQAYEPQQVFSTD